MAVGSHDIEQGERLPIRWAVKILATLAANHHQNVRSHPHPPYPAKHPETVTKTAVDRLRRCFTKISDEWAGRSECWEQVLRANRRITRPEWGIFFFRTLWKVSSHLILHRMRCSLQKKILKNPQSLNFYLICTHHKYFTVWNKCFLSAN